MNNVKHAISVYREAGAALSRRQSIRALKAAAFKQIISGIALGGAAVVGGVPAQLAAVTVAVTFVAANVLCVGCTEVEEYVERRKTCAAFKNEFSLK